LIGFAGLAVLDSAVKVLIFENFRGLDVGLIKNKLEGNWRQFPLSLFFQLPTPSPPKKSN
jgi:hypothetical protein